MKFSCPHCQQHLEADDSMAGTTVVCPACGKGFVIAVVRPSEMPQPEVLSLPSMPVSAPEAGQEPVTIPGTEVLLSPPPDSPKVAPKFRVLSRPEASRKPVAKPTFRVVSHPAASNQVAGKPKFRVVSPSRPDNQMKDIPGSRIRDGHSSGNGQPAPSGKHTVEKVILHELEDSTLSSQGAKQDTSATIKENCPHCSRPCEVPESAMGTYVDCASCGKRFRIQKMSPALSISGGNGRLSMTVALVFRSILLPISFLAPISSCLIIQTDLDAGTPKLREIQPYRVADEREQQFYLLPQENLDAIVERERRLHYYQVVRAAKTTHGYDDFGPGYWKWLYSEHKVRRNKMHVEEGKKDMLTSLTSQKPMDYWGMLTEKRINPHCQFIAVNPGDAARGYESVGDDMMPGMAAFAAGDEKAMAFSAFLFALLAIFSIVFSSVLHWKCWAAIPGSLARTTPGKAVAGFFCPVFNLFWVFPSIWGLGADCETLARNKGWQGKCRLKALGLALAILMCASLAMLLLGNVVCLKMIAEDSIDSVAHGFPWGIDRDIDLSLLSMCWAARGIPVLGSLVAIGEFVVWVLFYRGVTLSLNRLAADGNRLTLSM